MRNSMLMNKKDWFTRGLVTSFLALVLAGCGGGGSALGVSYTMPTVPTDPVQIDGTNAQAVAIDALSSTTGAAEAGYGGPSGVAVSGGSGNVVKTRLDDVIRRTNRILMDQKDATPMPAGASYTLFCNSVDDTNGTIVLTVKGNDSRIDYNSCDIWGDGSMVFDGAMAATNVSYTGDPYAPPFSMSATYTYNLTFSYNSGAEVIEMMGRFNMSMSDDGTNYSSSTSNGEMAMVTGDGTIVMTNMSSTSSCNSHGGYVYDYECYGTLTVTNNYTVAGTLSNGSFTVTTTTPLVTDISAGAEYPKSGVIQIDGANNSQMIITILDDEMGSNASANDLQIYVDPDTTDTSIVGGEATIFYTWATVYVT